MRNTFLTRSLLSVTFCLALAGAGSGMAQSYDVTVEPIGHWHVFDGKTLQFRVADADDDAGVEAAEVSALISRSGSERVTERSLADGDIRDLGAGTYALDHTATALGAHALVVRATVDEESYVSEPVAFEVAKAGEEGIRVTADDTSFVYQIRYVWKPGHIHASDDEPVTLEFEVMRGIQEGDEIDWQQPWTNDFDHVTSAENPRVLIESKDGSVTDEVAPTYQGRGIYRAERLFAVSEVGDDRDYTVRFVFTDPHHGAEVTHDDAYGLHAVGAH